MDRRIEVVQDVIRLAGEGVELRDGEVVVAVVLEAEVIDHAEEKEDQAPG